MSTPVSHTFHVVRVENLRNSTRSGTLKSLLTGVVLGVSLLGVGSLNAHAQSSPIAGGGATIPEIGGGQSGSPLVPSVAVGGAVVIGGSAQTEPVSSGAKLTPLQKAMLKARRLAKKQFFGITKRDINDPLGRMVAAGGVKGGGAGFCPPTMTPERCTTARTWHTYKRLGSALSKAPGAKEAAMNTPEARRARKAYEQWQQAMRSYVDLTEEDFYGSNPPRPNGMTDEEWALVQQYVQNSQTADERKQDQAAAEDAYFAAIDQSKSRRQRRIETPTPRVERKVVEKTGNEVITTSYKNDQSTSKTRTLPGDPATRSYYDGRINQAHFKADSNTKEINRNKQGISKNASAIASHSEHLKNLDLRDKQLQGEINRNRQGIAMSMAMQNPDFVAGEQFGMTFNFGSFDGANAIGVGMAGVLNDDFDGKGGRMTLGGALGYGLDESEVGTRVGIQLTW